MTESEAAGLRLVAGEDGIAFVVIDVPGEPINTFGAAAARAFGGLLDRIAADGKIRAVVIKSGKADNFLAGADINQFTEIASAADGETLSRAGQAMLDRVDRFPQPVVAAIHGACLGLGLELALACDYRVASDDKKTVLGVPEVQLGVLPGAGGTVRLPRKIGARAALDMILTGKSERAEKAWRLGLVEELVPVSILDRVAIAAAKSLVRGERPATERKRPGGMTTALLDRTSVGRLVVYRAARARVQRKTGGHYPAPLAALEVVRTGLEQGPEAGYRAEARAFGTLAVTSVSRELVRIFFATNALKKDDGGTGGRGQPHPVRRLAVVGSGFMGAGIAGTAAGTAKIEVRLKDTELARVGKGVRAATDLLRGQLTRRRITRPEFDRLSSLVTGSADWRGFDRVDLAIEAVFEELAVKQQVVAELERILPPQAIIASNTSTIPIARIAERASRPERIIGMHFFSPVDRMPLLEVIPTDRTDADTIVTAARFGRTLGKTVIVVADRPGFWVNRILAPYLGEAGRLLTEGVPIEIIDRTMTEFGFPVGPIALLDEVGLDVAAHAAVVMREAFGDRMAPAAAIAAMVSAGRIGRKAGRGFYLYHDGHKTDPDPGAYEVIGVKPLAEVDQGMVERRLVYALLNEAARARGEAVVRSNRDGDIGAIFGIGFPPFRGGPLRMVENLGPVVVAATLDDLATRFGPRFTPAAVLREDPEPA